ncbi:MAG: 2'-5' RNA ligase family protein [Cytophagales bacterium]|nr:2'-5' RNA ligase family protein [Cytophagales bacterium]
MASLYFIAVLPPEEESNQITELKHYCKSHFGSGHALKSPPHITLHMPFKWNDKKRAALDQCLSQVATATDPFEVRLRDFDFFEPRVVFVDVIENPVLKQLQQQLAKQMRLDLSLFNADYKDRPFHPHVTIAFRDLKKPKFFEAKTHFSQQELSMNFEIRDLVLLKHDGKGWQVDQRFSFAIR